MSDNRIAEQQDVLGHPRAFTHCSLPRCGKRFSYYGMRALLIFYMIKGFLGYGDTQAYTVYGAYTALVYMTPFMAACWLTNSGSTNGGHYWRLTDGRRALANDH